MRRLLLIITLSLALLPNLAHAATPTLWYQAASTENITAMYVCKTTGIVYYADSNNQTLKAILPNKSVSTLVQNIANIGGITSDTLGNLYYTDSGNHVVYKMSISSTQSLSEPIIIAGTMGTAGYTGDNAPASQATLNGPAGIAVDSSDTIYIADMGNHVIRSITGTNIATAAGTGIAGYSGDNGAATQAQLSSPAGMASDGSGNVLFTEIGNHTLRQLAFNTITTKAGTGTLGFAGDDGLSALAQLNQPEDVAIDSLGNIYIADTNNGRIRMINNTLMTTLANVSAPIAVAVDNSDNIYMVDNTNKQILFVDAGNASLGTPPNNLNCMSSTAPTWMLFALMLLLLSRFARSKTAQADISNP